MRDSLERALRRHGTAVLAAPGMRSGPFLRSPAQSTDGTPPSSASWRASRLSEADIAELAPRTFTRALFGYLLTTVDDENEYVANVAPLQVMETIGHHFFDALMSCAARHDLECAAFATHTEADTDHAQLGLETYERMTWEDVELSTRTIRELFELMGSVLDEWLTPRSYVR